MGRAPTPFGTMIKYEPKTLKIVGGNPVDRPDAIDKVTGRARYAADVCRIARASRHFVDGVRPVDWVPAHNLEGLRLIFDHCAERCWRSTHGQAPLISLAAAITASTILL